MCIAVAIESYVCVRTNKLLHATQLQRYVFAAIPLVALEMCMRAGGQC